MTFSPTSPTSPHAADLPEPTDVRASLVALPAPAAPLIRSLRGIGRADAAAVGAKAANLGEAARLGLEVAPGFVVTSPVAERFVAAARDGGLPPHSLANAVRSAYAQLSLDILGRAGDATVALRASPVDAWGLPKPDGSNDAWLNVRGADPLVDRLRTAWTQRSLGATPPGTWADGAGALAAPAPPPPFPVLVQEMLDCEAAGLAVPDGAGNVAVQASWGYGLGPQTAGAALRGDLFTVEAASGAVLSRAIRSKPVQVGVLPDGRPDWTPVPSHRRDAPCLTDEEASRVADAASVLQRHFGAAQELAFAVVWRRSGRRLVALKVRPLAAGHHEGSRERRPARPGATARPPTASAGAQGTATAEVA